MTIARARPLTRPSLRVDRGDWKRRARIQPPEQRSYDPVDCGAPLVPVHGLRLGRGFTRSEDCNFLPLTVFYGRTRENRMNSSQVRTHEMVMDGWPILVAFALYLVAFGVVAMTIASVIPVA
jgi:hypothetical protein